MAVEGHRVQLLDEPTLAYIKTQIETGQPRAAKAALQSICKLHRRGYRVRQNELPGIVQQVIGALYAQDDEKVRRWALNALARLGHEASCIEVIKHVLSKYSHEAQSTAAAIAAVYRLCRDPSVILNDLGFDQQMIALAALQHVDANKLDLSALPLDIETASPDLLQLALVVVGLDRAPPNFLNPRHNNNAMVRALGSHHNEIVSQYTVWAITENPSLGVRDLGIEIKDIERYPANVRSWVYQLLAMTPDNAEQYHEYIEMGSRDIEVEARAGLAVGLASTYFDGLEGLVLDWFMKESALDVRLNLIDHIIKQAHRCPNYAELSVDIYEREPLRSTERQRMAAAAAGTALYARFMRIELDGTPDLFRGARTVTNNTFNIQGGIQGAAVSLGGTATNTGSVSLHYSPQAIEAIQSAISRAERELHDSHIDPALKKEALTDLSAARAEPTPDNLHKAVSTLKKAGSLVTGTAQVVNQLTTIATALAGLAGLT